LTPCAAATVHGHELLGAEWLAKWHRSDAQMPLGADPDTDWRAAIEGHPQFACPPLQPAALLTPAPHIPCP
jgi:hypothetical protein